MRGLVVRGFKEREVKMLIFSRNAFLKKPWYLNSIAKGRSDSASILKGKPSCMICRWSQCGVREKEGTRVFLRFLS